MIKKLNKLIEQVIVHRKLEKAHREVVKASVVIVSICADKKSVLEILDEFKKFTLQQWKNK